MRPDDPVAYDWHREATCSPTLVTSSRPSSAEATPPTLSPRPATSQLTVAPLQRRPLTLLRRLKRNQAEFELFVEQQRERPLTARYSVAQTLSQHLDRLQSHSSTRFRAKSASGCRPSESDPFLQAFAKTQAKPITLRKTGGFPAPKPPPKVETARVLDYRFYSQAKKPLGFAQLDKSSRLNGDFAEFRDDPRDDSFLRDSLLPKKKIQLSRSPSPQPKPAPRIPRIYQSNSLLGQKVYHHPSSLRRQLYRGLPLLQRDVGLLVRRLTGKGLD